MFIYIICYTLLYQIYNIGQLDVIHLLLSLPKALHKAFEQSSYENSSHHKPDYKPIETKNGVGLQ